MRRISSDGVVGVLVVVALVVGVTLAAVGLGQFGGDKPTRKEFTDSVGRHCVQVDNGSGVALDCDYPPAESRVGDALNGLLDQARAS